MQIPRAFRFAATYAGIRKKKEADLGLIWSDEPCSAAAVFTTNQVQAACVTLARKHLAASGGEARAALVNAGNANCATRTGDKVALATCRAAARQLGIPVNRVIPSSTGVIGQELDPDLIVNALPDLIGKLSEDGFEAFASAIMTTDTRRKMAFREVKAGGAPVRIAGTTKGAGMIHPNMATTLGFVVTDAGFTPRRLAALLKRGIERSYNRLSVDGDTSTNDMVLVMANGASGVWPQGAVAQAFDEALGDLLEDLAKQIARDGEGATRLVTIRVRGAASPRAAEKIARAIGNSPLVKTAIAGSDANWGRILCAAGYAGVPFDPGKVDILLQGVPVCKGGLAAPFSEAEMKQRLQAPECEIDFHIKGSGAAATTFWTCDFTEEYIRINADYRT